MTNKNQPCPICGEVKFNYQMYGEYYCNNPAHSPRRTKKVYPEVYLLKVMAIDYKNKGERVDEVLFQEINKVIDRARKAEELLQKLYYEMGKSPDDDMRLWREVKSYVKERGPDG